MEEVKLVLKTVRGKMWRCIKWLLRVIWEIIYCILQFIFYIFVGSCYLIGLILPYVVIAGMIIGVLWLLLSAMIPEDKGPYYRFNKGWEQVTYLQSEWKCDITQMRNESKYNVYCTNLEDKSVRDFFTDYYEEGLHYIH